MMNIYRYMSSFFCNWSFYDDYGITCVAGFNKQILYYFFVLWANCIVNKEKCEFWRFSTVLFYRVHIDWVGKAEERRRWLWNYESEVEICVTANFVFWIVRFEFRIIYVKNWILNFGSWIWNSVSNFELLIFIFGYWNSRLVEEADYEYEVEICTVCKFYYSF